MKRIIVAVLAFFLVALPVSAQSVSDFAYFTNIAIVNGTGSALTNMPVRASVNALNMQNAGFLNSTATDMNLFSQGGGSTIPMTAQSITGNSASWWVHVGSLANGASVQNQLYSGSTSFITRTQGVGLYGTSENVTVTDTASLDPTTNLAFESLDTTLYTIGAGEQYLLNKPGAYAMGVDSSNSVWARMVSAASTTTPAGTPTASGQGAAGVNLAQTGCAAGSQHLCVNTNDGDTSYVYSATASGFVTSYYTIGGTGIPDGSWVSSVSGSARGRCVTGAASFNARIGIRIGGVDSFGTTTFSSTSYATNTVAISRPGGGDWQLSDFGTNGQLLLAIDNTSSCPTGAESRVTWVYLTITYFPATELTYSPIVAGTEYDFRADYDGATFRLLVDGVVQASTASAITVRQSTNNIQATGITGNIGRSVVRSFTTLADSSPNGNTATNSGARGVDGQLAGAMDFDGINDTMTVVPSATVNNMFAGGGTFSGWVNLDAADADSGRAAIFTKGATTLYGEVFNGTTWRIHFIQDFTGTDGRWQGPTGGVFTENAWNFFAVVYDRDSTGNTPIIYRGMPGVAPTPITLTTVATPTGTAVDDSASNFVIGGGTNVSPDGSIDDLRIRTGLLSQAQVQSDYATQLTGAESGLKAYWTLNNTPLDLAYEPGDVAETVEGIVGNGWTWEGTVQDVGQVALANQNNDGAYTFVRDTSVAVTVTVGATTAVAPLTSAATAETEPSAVTGAPDSGVTFTTGSTVADFAFPLSIVATIWNASGAPLILLAGIMAGAVAMLVLFGVWQATRIPGFTILLTVVAVWVIFVMTPLPTALGYLLAIAGIMALFMVPNAWERQ